MKTTVSIARLIWEQQQTLPNTAKHIDLGATEYAKMPSISKCYTDKFKLVLFSFIRLRQYILSKDTKTELKSVSLMLIEGLKVESFIPSLVGDDWLAIQKINDTDIPSNVESIKNGDINVRKSPTTLILIISLMLWSVVLFCFKAFFILSFAVVSFSTVWFVMISSTTFELLIAANIFPSDRNHFLRFHYRHSQIHL